MTSTIFCTVSTLRMRETNPVNRLNSATVDGDQRQVDGIGQQHRRALQKQCITHESATQ